MATRIRKPVKRLQTRNRDSRTYYLDAEDVERLAQLVEAGVAVNASHAVSQAIRMFAAVNADKLRPEQEPANVA